MAERPFGNTSNSIAQQAVRAAFAKVTKQWKTLSAAQAATWNSFAAGITETEHITGNQVKRTGFNWFVALGSRYLLVTPGSTTVPTNAPTSSFGGDDLQISLLAQAGGIKLTANKANSAKTTTALQFQKLSSANGHPGKQYLTKTHFQFTSGALTTTVALPPGVYSVAIQYVNLDTGQETVRTVLGTPGPVTFAVAAGGKKAA